MRPKLLLFYVVSASFLPILRPLPFLAQLYWKLICRTSIVHSELNNGKVPGLDKVYNEIFKKAIGTGFYTHFARAFTLSLKLGYIPYAWKIAVLCMVIKPDKPPSQTTSYRPIS